MNSGTCTGCHKKFRHHASRILAKFKGLTFIEKLAVIVAYATTIFWTNLLISVALWQSQHFDLAGVLFLAKGTMISMISFLLLLIFVAEPWKENHQ